MIIEDIISPSGCGYAEFRALAQATFGTDPLPHWPVTAAFDATGRCVAGLQHAILTLEGDASRCPATAIRNVVVAEECRGCGHMRALMTHALRRCETRAGLTLLYAEAPALYARFDFVPVRQHGFEGAAPEPAGPATARAITPDALATLDRRLAGRTATSGRLFLGDDAGLTAQALRSGRWPVALDPTLDALIVYEEEEDTLVLVDVVATVMPSAALILGALGARPARLRTLFSPDRLDWIGRPVVEDAGLMARGALPAIMRRPFILPPTVEF